MFHSARLKLTAWYLLIIMLVSVSFSLVIYNMLHLEVQRFEMAQRFRIERRFIERGAPPPPVSLRETDLVKETEQRIALMLMVVNASILVISGAFGYFLAGRTLKPIMEMVDEQNRFISDASHELRTPLTALKSSMEVNLRDKKLTLSDARNLIAGSITEVDKLQILSDSLLRLSQYQKSDHQTKFERIDAAEAVKEAVKKVTPLARNKDIVIVSDITKGEIEGNRYSLEELAVILLDNAIKYSPEKAKVTISAGKSDGNVFISIGDQGPGIDKKDLPHIFDRFYRADNTRSKNSVSGYGLGLSIAKQIAEMHHGSISVQSKAKKGTVFTVKLPVKNYET
jgi:signal transduction histidine kinase